jgi:hypothetical protein
LHFHSQIIIFGSFVTFCDCSFSHPQFRSIHSMHQSHIFIDSCTFRNVADSPFHFGDKNEITICDTHFSNCGFSTSLHACSDIKIIS